MVRSGPEWSVSYLPNHIKSTTQKNAIKVLVYAWEIYILGFAGRLGSGAGGRGLFFIFNCFYLIPWPHTLLAKQNKISASAIRVRADTPTNFVSFSPLNGRGAQVNSWLFPTGHLDS